MHNRGRQPAIWKESMRHLNREIVIMHACLATSSWDASQRKRTSTSTFLNISWLYFVSTSQRGVHHSVAHLSCKAFIIKYVQQTQNLRGLFGNSLFMLLLDRKNALDYNKTLQQSDLQKLYSGPWVLEGLAWYVVSSYCCRTLFKSLQVVISSKVSCFPRLVLVLQWFKPKLCSIAEKSPAMPLELITATVESCKQVLIKF